MISFDAAQSRVLGLDARRHARIIGAAGTGKTTLLVESYANILENSGWQPADLLVLAPNRLVASRVRTLVEQRVRRVLAGVPVRTASSFAFSLLNSYAAQLGDPPPRLLTGAAHDETISEVVGAYIDAPGESHDSQASRLAPEVLLSAPFRAELRELARVLDDFDIDPVDMRVQLAELSVRARTEIYTRFPDPAISARWDEGLALLTEVGEVLAKTRPGELSASSLLRRGAALIRSGAVSAPMLVLVDDAQELGEGQLALLTACAMRGSAVWVFGDPDTSTGAFQGERTSILAGVHGELARRGWENHAGDDEQVVVLETVFRHGPTIRGFVRDLSERLGVSGGGAQREASSSVAADADAVEFARVASSTEQLGVIAHRMRARRLGIGGGTRQLKWDDMAVVCRSRAEASRVARLLAMHQVPAGVAAGGVVLREHSIVRELVVLLQHALGIRPLDAAAILQLAGGVIGGLDAVAVRRLRGAMLIEERRAARAEQRDALSIDELIYDGFMFPDTGRVPDSAGGRAIRKLGQIARSGARTHTSGGTPREVLWALWEGTKLAERWQRDAVSGRRSTADDANRSLDATLGLFFALQRHEEQNSSQPIEDLLEELLASTVPQDSLAQSSLRDTITVTTPQGLVGREFALVTVLGVQEGAWPNVRAHGSLLGTAALERWLRGGQALPASRRETIHDELRLFLQSCSRATEELLVVAVADDEQYPSPFFAFGEAFETQELPSARLTLRGVTAEKRRQVVTNPDGVDAVASLTELALAAVPGAHPDDWYGVLPASSDIPLFAGASGDTAQSIPVSPSQLERAEECALDWVIAALGGGSGNVQASLGTLVHHALETAENTDAEALLETINAEWKKLPFQAEWESERMQRLAQQMAQGLSEYLRAFEVSDRQLLGRESRFSVQIGNAQLRGVADRIEARPTPEGIEVQVVDLKTGKTAVSGPAAEEHVQLQAYQLGASLGALEVETQGSDEAQLQTSAKLLYVHPDSANGKGFVERKQAELTQERKAALMQRVSDVAEVMAASNFTARIEHHCSDPHKPGNCRLHIIQAVSHA
ncbi:UrvD/REP family ATP-dependent DNA helicase [Leucobacter denitrificans]|uniref:DNA 3'-5' helicase n=1 Tax=Leucobacter denitrificans TaxID=683042 RepID=A0A7G9S4W3_9MICO|nr:UrvD/REP family ATP-dependent DNA helicase [Leucobacter denitrificans]QNN62888.1 ATP-dependent helicase [Leucobacter denitrificans]